MASWVNQVLIAGAVVVGLGGVVVGLCVRSAHLKAERTKLAVAQTRDQARQVIPYCTNRAGFTGTISMGTANVGMYIATHDRANLQRVMRDVVEPALGAYEMACATAKADITFVQENRAEGDSSIDAEAEEVDATIADLDRARVANHTLRAAIDSNANDDVIGARFVAFIAATKPQPAPP